MNLKIEFDTINRALLFVIVLELFGLLVIKLMNLQFDTYIFNNIATPIISFLGVVIVAGTLMIMLESRKARFSQDSLDSYVDKIDEQKEKGIKTDINTYYNLTHKISGANLINFDPTFYFYSQLIRDDDEYMEDLEDIKNNKISDINYYMNRTYYKPLKEFVRFIGGPIIFYQDCKHIVRQIQSDSRLLNVHREILLKRVISNLINNYLIFCKFITDKDGVQYNFKSFYPDNLKYGLSLETADAIDIIFLRLYYHFIWDKKLSKFFEEEIGSSILTQ